MLKTLEKYIDERPARGALDRARLWLHDERVFARLLAISCVLHLLFYTGLILLNTWEMRQIKPRRPQGSSLRLIAELVPSQPPTKLRNPTVALERADVSRFQFDPETANDTDLIARSPNPSTQRPSSSYRPAAGEPAERQRRVGGGGDQRATPDQSAGLPPPAIAAVPNVRPPVPATPSGLSPGITSPAPPAPRPAPGPTPDPAAGTQRGAGIESTAFGTQRIQAQYIALVRAKVRRNNEAYMPRDYINTTLSREESADFALVVNRLGQIVKLDLIRPSGYRALDVTARQAIVNASPFEGYPQSAGETIPLIVTVYYTPSR